MGLLSTLVGRARGWVSELIGRGKPEPAPPGQAPDVPEVVRRLKAIGDQLEPGDGVGAFHKMYLRVTELVGQKIDEGYFRDAELLTRLDVVFAGLYLDAARAQEPALADPC